MIVTFLPTQLGLSYALRMVATLGMTEIGDSVQRTKIFWTQIQLYDNDIKFQQHEYFRFTFAS